MKTLVAVSSLAVCLLAAQVDALAQTPSRETARPAAQRDAEEARTRKQLDEARERLDKAAREVAELSAKLGANAREDIRIFTGAPGRAVLGIQIDDDPGKEGVRVLSVSPGGPAAEAGLRDRDVIIALDGEPLPGTGAGRALVERMRTVKPEQKVKVRVLREGKRQDYVVIARASLPAVHAMALPMPVPGMDADVAMAGDMPAGMAVVKRFQFWPGEFAGLELASVTPKLGAYFGVTKGVLVVSAPRDGAFKLEDGDVLQAIDGRKPDDGPHALRILRSYQTGEKLTLSVLRQRKAVSLAVTMPERSGMGEMDWPDLVAPVPPVPPAPPAPAAAGRPGTEE